MFDMMTALEGYLDPATEGFGRDNLKNGGVVSSATIMKRLDVLHEYTQLLAESVTICTSGAIKDSTYTDALNAVNAAINYRSKKFRAVGLHKPAPKSLVNYASDPNPSGTAKRESTAQAAASRGVTPADAKTVAGLDKRFGEVSVLYERCTTCLREYDTNKNQSESFKGSIHDKAMGLVRDETRWLRYDLMHIGDDITDYANSVGHDREVYRDWLR